MSTRLSLPRRSFAKAGAAAVVLLAAISIVELPQLTDQVAAQTAAAKIPRTPDGKPNLQGIWQVRNRAAYNIEDHHARFNMPAGKGVVEGGAIPYQEWALKKREANFANRYKEDPFSKCYMPGVPRIMYIDFPFQVFQSSTHVAMTFEWTNVHRLIYTNGTKPPQGIEFWMGDARGRWEGDTFVVETANFTSETNFRGPPRTTRQDITTSTRLKVTERFTLVDRDNIRYEFTVNDPDTWTRPWSGEVPMRRIDGPIYEYACHEGNYGLANILRAARVQEANAR